MEKKEIFAIFTSLVVVALAIWGGNYLVSNRGASDTNDNLAAPNNNLINPVENVGQPESIAKNNTHMITIKTNYGEIQFQTYDNDAPKTVKNFITLAEKGFYNNLTFHRVIKGFMIQGGDPQGSGMGGPGYSFEDELNPNTDSFKAGYKKGVVAMANAGPDTNGSQFFIMLEDYPLPNDYTIFGKVIKGQAVVDTIGSVTTDKNDKPMKPVIMESVSVAP